MMDYLHFERVGDHLSTMPELAILINTDLKRRFAVTQAWGGKWFKKKSGARF